MKESMKTALILGASLGLISGIFTVMTYFYFNPGPMEAIPIRVFLADYTSYRGQDAFMILSYGQGKYKFKYNDQSPPYITDPDSLEFNKTYVFECRRLPGRYWYTVYEFYPIEECLNERGYIEKLPRPESPIWRETT